MSVTESKHSPWDVTSLDDFLFYCCPECDSKHVTKPKFILHAFKQHPEAKDYLGNLEGCTVEDDVEVEEINQEELDSESQKPNIQEKKLVQEKLYESQKNLMQAKLDKVKVEPYVQDHVQEYHSDSDSEFEQIKNESEEEFIPDGVEVTGEIVNKCRCNFCSLPFETTFELKKHVTQCSHLKQFHSSDLEEENFVEESEKPKRKSEKIVENKKMCKSLPDSNNSHQNEVESEPVKKKQRRTQDVGIKVQKCPHCSFESDLPHVFKKHTNSFRICSICNEIFCGTRAKERFKTHQKKHIVKPVHDCKVCNKSFRVPSGLKRHYRDSACGRHPETQLDSRYTKQS